MLSDCERNRAQRRFENALPLERFPAEWNHSVEKKSLQTQKLEHILIAQIDST
jgi:hypothetical protein